MDTPKDPSSPKGLSQLEGRKWDAVIDTSGYFPRMVKASAELLAPKVRQYVFTFKWYLTLPPALRNGVAPQFAKRPNEEPWLETEKRVLERWRAGAVDKTAFAPK